MLHLYQGCLPQQMAPYYQVCNKTKFRDSNLPTHLSPNIFKRKTHWRIVLMTWNQIKMSSAGDGGVANNSLQAPPKIEQSLQVQKIFRGIKNGFTEKNQLFSKNYFQAVSPMETCWIWKVTPHPSMAHWCKDWMTLGGCETFIFERSHSVSFLLDLLSKNTVTPLVNLNQFNNILNLLFRTIEIYKM